MRIASSTFDKSSVLDPEPAEGSRLEKNIFYKIDQFFPHIICEIFPKRRKYFSDFEIYVVAVNTHDQIMQISAIGFRNLRKHAPSAGEDIAHAAVSAFSKH